MMIHENGLQHSHSPLQKLDQTAVIRLVVGRSVILPGLQGVIWKLCAQEMLKNAAPRVRWFS